MTTGVSALDGLEGVETCNKLRLTRLTRHGTGSRAKVTERKSGQLRSVLKSGKKCAKSRANIAADRIAIACRTRARAYLKLGARLVRGWDSRPEETMLRERLQLRTQQTESDTWSA